MVSFNCDFNEFKIMEEQTSESTEEDSLDENQHTCEAGEDNRPNAENITDDKEEDIQAVNVNDSELMKCLNKQRRRAIATGWGGTEELYLQKLVERRAVNPSRIPKFRNNRAAAEMCKEFIVG